MTPELKILSVFERVSSMGADYRARKKAGESGLVKARIVFAIDEVLDNQLPSKRKISLLFTSL